ncbi:polymorphic toxin-type HINT domain-containing protein [Phytohabitans sp. ZYX-F-186]|uniref:Polymorphic toxin-type HINT domain-containing protein n=1 Tax=Phytohabitans maris TaxID=3071409 RepID=A0ABU0ZWG4_9ACTN|nr:RHS repeat-associated core domain-containing protein [Phytohabitans sp. ZYX-F-186]MDQ7911374.1 polymorphic toxin-type HINT domain-containing protein [Phytohabitans sp. ZYX-F-186]
MAAAVVMTLVVTTAPSSAKPATQEVSKPAAPTTSPGPAVTKVKPLQFQFTKPRDAAAENFTPKATAWPKPVQASIDLAAPTAKTREGATTRAAGTPVWARAVASGDGRYAGPASVDARVLDQEVARAAGINGVLFTVAPAGGGGAGQVRVGLDYGEFAEAYGANYGSRLRLVQLPSCVTTTPDAAGCRRATPLRSTNDPAAQSVSASLTLSAAAPIVVAAVAGAGEEGGTGGTYAATDLKPSGSWSGGGSTGSFTYSYPITVPPAASSLAPRVELAYDSGSVDGQTAATQAQASWVGDGWSTPRSYIEQTFTSCADEPGGSPAPQPIADQCYNGPVLTMSLNGATTALVWDSTRQLWRPQTEDGSVIAHVTNSGNGSGTYNTDYWRVTARDGTVYEFGRNHLPGWSSGKAATNSVDRVPVYSPHSGDPCYNASGFSASWCDMAYRWNLDHVVDARGNAMAYYYKQDINHYGRNDGAVDEDYVRDSYLDRIDYGFRDGGAYGTVPNRVVFGTGPRCVSGTCTPLGESTKANWPDVPYDLICASGTNCDVWTPSFFSTVRLTSITTQQWSTATSSYPPVDSFALSQTIPATGDGNAPTLWLASIARTGHDTTAGGSTAAITLPSVSFASIKLPNRVDPAGLTAFYRHRIETVTTETGSVITASYELPQPCTAPVSLNPATNTRSCYPVYWTPDGYTAPFRDWFHKYAVTRVTATDPTGGAPATSTNYAYEGGAAWRYDENEVVKKKYRTYGQFRGYGTVKTLAGDGVNDPRTLSQTTYYRGMSKNNSTTVVNVTDSAGGVHEDLDQLAGKELETTAHLGEGGPVDNSTITSYWVSAATASRTRTGLPALTANWTAPVLTYSRQAVTGSGGTTWRYTTTDNSYDTSVTSPTVGVLKHAYTHTVPPDPAYDSCTTRTYAPTNTSKNLVDLVAQVETVSVACGGYTAGTPASVPGTLNTLTAPSSVNRPAQVVTAERTFYDDTNWATAFPQTAAPTTGNVTMKRRAVDYTGGAYTWQTTTRSTYDSYGRPVDTYDGNGNKTTYGYTTNSVGLTTAATVTNPLSQTTTSTLDTLRGLTTTTTDPNNVVTTQQYDALGRATAVWLYSRATTVSANYKFSYLVQKNDVTATTTSKLNDSSGYVASTTIYDAQLRVRQTQAMTPQSGRMVTDAFYDSRGWVRSSNNGWWHPGSLPSTTPIRPDQVSPPPQLPNQTFYTYDGLGRVVVEAAAKNNLEVSRTTTVYNGDRTTVIPPEGGVVKTTVTDPLGRTSQLLDHSVKPTLNTPANTFTGIFSITGGTAVTSTYGYDSHGNQNSVTDADGNTWTSTYNLLGQVTAKSDPDAGDTTGMTYDGNGNLLQATDARARTTSTTYDALNRRTGRYAAPTASQSAANQLAAWVYDNANNAIATPRYVVGQLTTATAYSGGAAYTVQQTNFNVFGKPVGQTVTIPASEGLLGGTYTFNYQYSTTTGLLGRISYPPKGALPAETVTHGYSTAFDLPSTLAGLGGYAQGVTYDAFTRVNQQTIGGAVPDRAFVTNTYDDHTGRLTDQLVTRMGTTPGDVDKQHYDYDKAGNPIRQVSTRLGATTPSETQCFRYDNLQRLTKAWTATDNCAVEPTPTSRAMVGSGLGSTSAYWTGWEFDPIGNRTRQTRYSTTGGSDTTTTYTYDGNGADQPHTLTSTATTGAAPSSTTYGYDTAGNTTSRNAGNGNQTLTWNDAGQLTAINGSTAGNSTFLYDADGNLLMQKDPGATTLYLPGQQLTLNTTTQAITGARYHALPGGGMAIRTGSGANYSFAITDRQGTPTLYLNNTAQTPTWRQYTPYGEPRGVISAWPDNRGFLNKPTNAATGLTNIGARDYDPAAGRFISIDPIMDLTVPQQWNGYAYSENNPTTFSDPTGEKSCSDFVCAPGADYTDINGDYVNSPGHNDGCGGCSGSEDPEYPQGENPNRNRLGRVIVIPDSVSKEEFTRIWFNNLKKEYASFGPFYNDYEAAHQEYAYAMWVCRQMGGNGCGEWYGELYDGFVATLSDLPMDERSLGPNVTLGPNGIQFKNPKVPGPESPPATNGKSGLTGGCRSFGADTKVLMADGSAKPISEVQDGDQVLAAAPESGAVGSQTVTHAWHHEDELVSLELVGASIVTTEDHPFWNQTDRQWQLAEDLDAGDELTTPSGDAVTVVGLVDGSRHVDVAYNLTVAVVHTYYVFVGTQPVLVHNCPAGGGGQYIKGYTSHGQQRMDERGISRDMAEQAVASGRRSRGHDPGTTKYTGRKVWVVLNKAGKVISAGWN